MCFAGVVSIDNQTGQKAQEIMTPKPAVRNLSTDAMHRLLEKHRHDGKRFWFRDATGTWSPNSAWSTTLLLAHHLKISRKEAALVRDSLKAAANKINDPVWAGKG